MASQIAKPDSQEFQQRRSAELPRFVESAAVIHSPVLAICRSVRSKLRSEHTNGVGWIMPLSSTYITRRYGESGKERPGSKVRNI